MSKDFFERKEVKVSDDGYDGKNFEDDFAACGLEKDGFKAKYENMFSSLNIDIEEENPVVTICSAIENNLTRREMAFVMAKDITSQLMEQMNKEVEQEKEE